VKISNKICGFRFRFSEFVLAGIKFGLEMVWNVLTYDNLECFGKNNEKKEIGL
jgi:hypothetical protein